MMEHDSVVARSMLQRLNDSGWDAGADPGSTNTNKNK
jgi:hypothetical protein